MIKNLSTKSSDDQKNEKNPRLSLPALRALRCFLDAGDEVLSGAEIIRAINVASGTLYPILQRFEEAGWLVGSWEQIDAKEAGRPARHLYKLTEKGTSKTKAAIELIS